MIFGKDRKKGKGRGHRVLAVCLAVLLLCGMVPIPSFAAQTTASSVITEQDCRSAILMEAETGKVLYEQNSDVALPPASVTKIMTLLLVMEAIEDGRLAYDDMVTAGAHACSMGGSQIYLEEGEQMSVEDMIKSVVIASANDAAVALAEHVAGSEEAFVEQMNRKAEELGMDNTNFENTNGLDDTAVNHVTSARDIALMSRALIRHKKITDYSSIWMDTIRNGAFGLTNTNRLIRFYKGATGLKTGSTSKAGFCVSATAERDGMTLICVIMAAPSRDIRNAAATRLLDWGFANFTRWTSSDGSLENIAVTRGVQSSCTLSYPSFSAVVPKTDSKRIQLSMEYPEALPAPLKKGDTVGYVIYTLDNQELGRVPIVAGEDVEAVTFGHVLLKLLQTMSFS